MDEHLARVIGERVRARRTAGRRKKTVVAGLTGITADYLYQIERGMKLPTVTVLAKLAEVLGLSVAELLGEESATNTRPSNTAAGEALYCALVNPPISATSVPPAVTELHERIARAWRTWQTSPQRYSQLASRLPALIIDTEAAVQAYQAEAMSGLRHAKSSAVDLYNLVRTVTKRLGRFDLSLLAAERAVRAAEIADDALRLGVARWNLAQVLLADGQPEGAEMLAMQAAEALRPVMAEGEADTAAIYGALLLIGAVAVARQGDAWTARSRLREVAPLAERTGECNTLWTAFGPTNVAMYAVTVEIEAGEAAEGLRLAEQIDYGHSPSIERRVAFLLDQAKGYEQRRDYASALLLLHTAEREAPEDVRHRPAALVILRTVVLHGRRSVSAEATQLAARIGLSLN
ncbi:MAG: helix-turn-helix domain-containing protein [Pseudonocardiaceae bacterium]